MFRYSSAKLNGLRESTTHKKSFKSSSLKKFAEQVIFRRTALSFLNKKLIEMAANPIPFGPTCVQDFFFSAT